MTGGFPASYRLKIKSQFDWVFARPNQRCSHGVLQAIYKPAQTHQNPTRNTAPNLDAISGENSNKIIELKNSNHPFSLSGPRLGLIVAKRFLPRAVDRNHLKRLIREVFRVQRSDLPDVDIIVRLLRRPDRQVSAGEVAVLFGKMQRPSNPPDADNSK